MSRFIVLWSEVSVTDDRFLRSISQDKTRRTGIRMYIMRCIRIVIKDKNGVKDPILNYEKLFLGSIDFYGMYVVPSFVLTTLLK